MATPVQITETPQQVLPTEGSPVPSKGSITEGGGGVTLPPKNPMAPSANDKAPEKQFASLFQEAKRVIRAVVKDESLQELDWLTAARTRLHGSQLSYKDADLLRWIAEAKAEKLGRKDFIVPGEKLDTRPTRWLWEGIIQRGSLNLVHAAPKVGKTRLLIAMLGAFINGEESFLEQPLHQGPEHLLILGPDMKENQWATYLKSAGLVKEGGTLSDRVAALVAQGSGFNIDSYWLVKVEEKLSSLGRGNAIVLLDSFAAATSQLPYDENKKEIATPLYDIKNLCDAWDATLIVIHHSKKGETGKGAVAGSRGNSAIPAAADNIVDMRRFQADGDPQKKIEVVVEGRHDSDGNLLFSQDKKTKEWICHGSTFELRQEKAGEASYLALTNVQTEVLHGLVHHFQKTGQPLTTTKLREQLEWPDGESKRTHMHKIIKALLSKGFVEEVSKEKFGRYHHITYGPTARALTLCPAEQYPGI